MVSKLAIQATLVLVTSYVLCEPAASGQSQGPVDVPCRASWKAHCGLIYSISPSLDGHQLVTCGYDDGTVKFWDLETGMEIRRFDQESRDGKARIWDKISQNQRRLIKELPVDDYVPWYDDSRSAMKRRRDLRSHRHVRMKYPMHFQAALLPDNHRVVLRIADYFTVCPTQIMIYDLDRGIHKTVFTSGRRDGPSKGLPMDYVLSRDRRFIVFPVTNLDNEIDARPKRGSEHRWLNRELYIYDSTENRISGRIGAGDGLGIQRLALSKDSHFLVNIAKTDFFARNRRAQNGHVSVWGFPEGGKVADVPTDGRYVKQAIFAPNGKELVVLSGLHESVIDMVSLDTCQIARTLSDFSHGSVRGKFGIDELRYTPDGRFLVGFGGTCAADGYARTAIFWNARDYREVLCARLSRNSSAIKTAMTRDGKRLLVALQDGDDGGMVKVWDMKDFIERMPSRNVPPPKIVPRVQPREKSRATEGK